MSENIQSTEIAWTWSSIFKLALTTGFFTAILNQGLSWIKETLQRRENDRRAGTVLALNLVDALTSYAQACNAFVRSNKWDQGVGDYGSSNIPSLQPYSEQKSGWETLPPWLAAKLNDFRNDIDYRKNIVSESRDVNGPDDAINSASYHSNILGYQAWMLSLYLRKQYSLGGYSGRWDFVDELSVGYRKAHPNIFRRLWRSPHVRKLRTYGRRQIRRVHFLNK